MKRIDSLFLEISALYKEEVLPEVSHIRGFTRIYKILEEITLRKITSRKKDFYEFELKDQRLRIKDYRDLKYFLMEKEFVQEFIQSIDEDSVVCDIGSYHGFYSVVGSLGREIYAFEMSQENSEKIRENFKLNDIPASNLVTKAVWSGEEKLEAGMEDSSTNTVGEGEEIESVSLDEFLRGKGKPDIVKIDVEGAEYRVLKGMEEILEEKKPQIFIEIHSDEMIEAQGGTGEKVLQILDEAGYEEEFLKERGSETLKIFR